MHGACFVQLLYFSTVEIVGVISFSDEEDAVDEHFV